MRIKKVFLYICCFLLVGSFDHAAYAARAGHGATAMYGAMPWQEALVLLQKNNTAYVQAKHNDADISLAVRQKNAQEGQNPHTLILSCADSRVPPEHIFLAGIGELFVVRNAGNVLSETVLASIEYAVLHLGIKLVVVLGHSHCGAVGAALAYDGKAQQEVAPSALSGVVRHIHATLQGEKDPRKAEKANVQSVLQTVAAHPPLQKYFQGEHAVVRGALYDLESGRVEFLVP